jgi:hypothetical protein
MVGMRVARHLGYVQDADAEWSNWKNAYRHADPKGNKLDIADQGVVDKNFYACEAKMMWMIDSMEKRFGNDLMARWLKIVRTKHPEKSPSMQESLHYFELAAKEDLQVWFQELGISYAPPGKR